MYRLSDKKQKLLDGLTMEEKDQLIDKMMEDIEKAYEKLPEEEKKQHEKE